MKKLKRKNQSIVVIYSAMANYFLQCMNCFSKEFNYDIIIFCEQIDKEAPYNFVISNRITFNNINLFNAYEIKNMIYSIAPKAVYIVNWGKIKYIKIAILLNVNFINCPIIVGMDKPWIGSVKQRIAATLYLLHVRNIFTHVWLTGIHQYEFARRMGFNPNNIITGLYCANIEEFSKAISVRNTIDYPKILLYVGRFLDWKGITDLYSVFSDFSVEDRNGWKLYLVGNGYLKNSLVTSNDVKIFDFLQEQELITLAGTCGAFCLPSWFEHWGVVVQEFASSGLPLILSDNVSSGSEFLIDGYNGYLFKAKNQVSLRKILYKLFHSSESQLKTMGVRSYELAQKNTPNVWTYKLKQVIDTF